MNKDFQQLSKEIDTKLTKQNIEIDRKLTKQNVEIDKKLVRQSKELNRDYQNQGKFLLEEFGKQIKIIAEVQTDQTKKLDSVIEMVGKNTGDIEIIKGMLRRKVDIEEFESLDRRVCVIEKKLRFNS